MDSIESAVQVFRASYPVSFVLQYVLEIHSDNQRRSLHFSHLYLNTSANEIVDENCQIILSDTIFIHAPKLIDIIRNVYLILHFVSSSLQHYAILTGHISLLARVLKASASMLEPTDFAILKEIVFVRPGGLKSLMVVPSSSDVLEGMSELIFPMVNLSQFFTGIQILLESTVISASESDRILLSDISEYWFNVIVTDLSKQSAESVRTLYI